MEIYSDIKNRLQRQQFPNEAAVSMGIVIPVLSFLNWPATNMSVVYPEFPLKGRNVDFGLCPKEDNVPSVIIEVKRVGNLGTADEQLFEYAFHAGAAVAILTDGREWHFYFPATFGQYNDKRFYKLDLINDDVEIIDEKFHRYLSYENVKSGLFIDFAQKDLQETRQKLEAKETIPKAFFSLIQEENQELIQIISERVADHLGFSPEKNHVIDFLNKIAGMSSKDVPALQPSQLRPQKQKESVPGTTTFYCSFLGRKVTGRTPTEVFLQVMNRISSEYEHVIPKFLATREKSARKVIAKNKVDLFPKRPDLIERYAKKLQSGYWVDTNNSTATKKQILEKMLGLAQIRGYDLFLEY